MLVMKHKTFEDHKFSMSRSKSRERAREAAESFINSIGAEKVLSVSEESEPSSVTVWYREEGDPRPRKDVMPEV